MTPLHLGDLHAYEQALVMLVALGPFAVLGVAVHLVRKRDLATRQAERAEQAEQGQRGAALEPGKD